MVNKTVKGWSFYICLSARLLRVFWTSFDKTLEGWGVVQVDQALLAHGRDP